MKSSTKGGGIGLIVALISIASFYSCINFIFTDAAGIICEVTPTFIVGSWIIHIIDFISRDFIYNFFHTDQIYDIYASLLGLIAFSIIGALIGSTVGKLRKRK